MNKECSVVNTIASHTSCPHGGSRTSCFRGRSSTELRFVLLYVFHSQEVQLGEPLETNEPLIFRRDNQSPDHVSKRPPSTLSSDVAFTENRSRHCTGLHAANQRPPSCYCSWWVTYSGALEFFKLTSPSALNALLLFRCLCSIRIGVALAVPTMKLWMTTRKVDK